MPNVGSAFRSLCMTKTAITNLISTRMYPDVLVQSAQMPAVVYYVVSTRREKLIGKMSRMAHARIQIDCYALTRSGANAIAEAFRTCQLDEYRGTTGSIFFNGIEIEDGEQYIQEPPTDGNQEHRYLTSFDLLVHYTEGS